MNVEPLSPLPAEPAPRVTIVTPSFNQAEFLEATIASVLAQDYPNIEYMVVDGGSRDASVSIIKKHADNLAYWTSGPDAGQSSAINKGWRRATGQILAYLNSDDTYLPGAVRTAVEFLIARPEIAVVYGDCHAIDRNGQTIETYRAHDFDYVRVIETCQTPIAQPAAFMRAEVLRKVGWLDESLHIAMDFDFWLRTALHYRLEHLPVTLATYRLHPASKSRSQGAMTGPDVIRIYEKLLDNPAFPAPLRRRPRRVLSSAYRRAADEYYAAVCLCEARASWRRAWTLYPPSLGPREYLAIVNTWVRPLRRRLRSEVSAPAAGYVSSDPESRIPNPESRSLTVFVVFRVELWRGARHWAGVSMVEGLARAGHRVHLFIRPDWLWNPIFAHLTGLGVRVVKPSAAFVALSVSYRKVTKFIRILVRSVLRWQSFRITRRDFAAQHDGRELEYWWLRRQLVKAARKAQPDVVHAFGATKWTATGVEWAAACRLPVVYTETQQVGDEQYTTLLKSFMHRCRAITLHGAKLLEGFRQIGYTGPHRVIPFSIPEPAAQAGAGMVSTKLPSNGAVVIGTASRYDPDKGLALLVEALSILARRYPESRLVLAGEGPERDRLRRQVAQLGLEDRVEIREPYELEGGLARFMSGIDVYCLPSLREGQPVSIIEAMAFGKPVVASAVGSIAEMLEGGAGLVARPGDATALAEALEKLVADSALRIAMGRRARERYLERHRPEAVIRAHVDFYTSLIAPHEAVSGWQEPEPLSDA